MPILCTLSRLFLSVSQRMSFWSSPMDAMTGRCGCRAKKSFLLKSSMTCFVS
jgi:hypothetical protein